MKYLKVVESVLVFCITVVIFQLVAWAEEKCPAPDTYQIHMSKVHEIMKAPTDDPRDLTVTYNIKDFVPPEILDKLYFDQEKMKKGTAELLGFTAPEVVGKIAPEIKPGKYTYKDVEQNSAFKDLFPPELRQHIKKPGPPFVCSISEFEIIPTKQAHANLPLIEVTKRNLGKTKLDKDGYIVPWSWQGGIPFPKPSGKLKPQQVYYSFEKRYDGFDKNFFLYTDSYGYDRNLKLDKYTQAMVHNTRFMGRVLLPPYGWFDERAKKNGEFSAFSYAIFEPRAMRGMSILNYHYDDPNKLDALMIYVPSLRRIRKMSATDTQDTQGDTAYDDSDMLSQKITPKKFPYKFEIIAEREYLMPYSYGTAPAWVDSRNNYELKEIQFQRRPIYVLQMNQLDSNYLYSKRVFYIDKESFVALLGCYYDQKGRLYRAQIYAGFTHFPECGISLSYGGYVVQVDYVDLHSTFQSLANIPAVFPRKYFSMQHLIKMGK